MAIWELEAPAFVKMDCPVTMFWANKEQTLETTRKCNSGAKEDDDQNLEDCEHNLVVDEYLKDYETQKESTEAWKENKGIYYYLILQHSPPELKIKLKNLAWWEATTADTYVVALPLIIWDVIHTKQERLQSNMGLVKSDSVLYTIIMDSKDTIDEYYRVFKAQVNMI
jgi:hypothetical protein